MSLARKLALRITALIVGLAVLAGASVWGLMGLGGYFQVAEDEYRQLRSVYEVGHHAATARLMINADLGDRAAIVDELNNALEQTRSLRGDVDVARLEAMAAALSSVITRAQQQRDLQPSLASINTTLGQVAELAADLRQSIIDNRRAASAHLRNTIIAVTAVAAFMMLAGTWIGAAQYRSVMTPLRRLEHAVRRAAAADFNTPIEPEGDREFTRLAEQFNQMAAQLDTLYRDLEDQVRIRSRQLVQSERLASVGYLAAGFAHEINNPLGIICGYAESTLARMETSGDADSQTRTAKAMRIICEEAFRCRDITTKLLTLARPGSGDRQTVELEPVARRVIDMLAGLPQFKPHRISLDAGDTPLTVTANEGELVQVLINLVANALESIDRDAGHVRVRLARQAGWAVVEVTDDGRGMSDDTAARVFEPFFTDKPQRDLRGTGLGLSVAHAIVEQHGGRLRAASEGPGRGSTFTIELPAAASKPVEPTHA